MTVENNPNFGGVCQTTEVRKDMSEKQIGKRNNRYGCSWWTNGVDDISCFEHELDKKLEAIGYSSREGWTKGHRAKPFG